MTAGDLEAIKILKSAQAAQARHQRARNSPILPCRSVSVVREFLRSTSPVAWRNVNLIGNFDFTISSSPVDIEALAARYQDEDFWRRSMTEGDDDGPRG